MQLVGRKINLNMPKLLFLIRLSKKMEKLSLGCFKSFLATKILVFNKQFLLIEDIDSLTSNLKRYFTSDQSSGILKITARFENLIDNTEC